MKDKYTDMSIDCLKELYVNLCLGTMVYGAKTEMKRQEVLRAIEEKENKYDLWLCKSIINRPKS